MYTKLRGGIILYMGMLLERFLLGGDKNSFKKLSGDKLIWGCELTMGGAVTPKETMVKHHPFGIVLGWGINSVKCVSYELIIWSVIINGFFVSVMLNVCVFVPVAETWIILSRMFCKEYIPVNIRREIDSYN